MNEERVSPLPWQITDYLKGIAIAAVVFNHYIIFYFRSTSVFANGLMTFFYLLAGAGIYLSLSRGEAAGAARLGPGMLARFFFKRGSRIYPLYWIAYAVLTVWLFRLGVQSDFDLTSLVTAVAGAPANSTGAFWFVTSILECYLAAPFLYLIARKTDVHTCLAIALIAVAALIPVSLYLADAVTNPIVMAIVSYKRLFLGNLLVFFLGMLMPRVIERYRRRLTSIGLLLTSGAGLAVLVWATDHKDHLFVMSELYLAPVLFAAALLFCLAAVTLAPPLPLKKAVGLLGGASYPLYLFHIPFFMTLGTVGIIKLDSYASAGFTLLLSPIIVGVCVALGRGNEWARQGLGARLFGEW